MELKIDGKWWLPTDNVQHPGTLKYDDDGVFLTISGPFLPFVEIYSTIDKKDFIILGGLVDGKKVTLIAYNMYSQRDVIGPQYVFSKTQFQIKFIILGTNVQQVEDIKFHSILVEYSNLANWLRFDLDDKFLSVTIAKNPIYFTAYYKTIDGSVEDICCIQIFSSEKVIFEEFTNERTSTENIYVKFYNIKNNHLLDCLELTGVFRDFLNFIIADDILEAKSAMVPRIRPSEIACRFSSCLTVAAIWSPLKR